MGWVTQVLTDPDQDGRPYDSTPLPGDTARIPGNGGTLAFLPVYLSPLRTMRELPTGHEEEAAVPVAE